MKIAIVTGASSGLGRAYAKQLDRLLHPDEIWLIARREERLQALAGELGCRGRVLAMDLKRRESVEVLEALLAEERPEVAALVCAAGFGKFGRAQDLTAEETGDMIALNCRSAVEVTRVCLPYLERGSRLLEVASCAGFQPLPGMNLYAATKAFLLRYTQALRWELRGRGVKVTAVCPYWVKTEFMAVARDTANPDAVRHTPFAMRPEAVAAWSLTMNGLDLAVATCGPIPFAMEVGSKVLPACVPMALWDKLRRM
ncbi:SDR family NAD(P)-dependent oxidoreductase [Vermiculatibacterium agrestimuris]|uniref:SDR family NAD(P)-dependent oxidoreductase n=1 Tax=Vermiculatibacterium agrestimuris TaxID=2941519 RepID=UPI0020420E2F|nr:SDR family NAD(P)-dependent oxidoreductase [Vermiculatibacterium agrestimuris]